MAKAKKRADGRYVRTVTDKRTGKRLYFYADSERELNSKLLEYSSRSKRGRDFITVSDEWWEGAEPRLAYQSIRGYRRAKNRADLYFGKKLIKDINARDVAKYLRSLASDELSQKSVAHYRLVMNRIFTHAVLEGDIEYNPCTYVEVPKGLSKKARSSASESDEKIVKASADVWLFPYMALMTGMRKGEILALQWRDIDFERNIIYVTKSVYHEGDKPHIKQPKTEAGNRIVPLLRPLKEKLSQIEQQIPTNYIISDTGEAPLTNRRFTTLMNNYRKKTGVTCTAHELRHSFATIAFENGIEPKTVQEILGHKQLSTTMDIYTTFREKSILTAAEKLNSAF